jgi:hypothetical protein
MTVESKPFIGKKCEHEDSEVDIFYQGGSFDISYSCPQCGGENRYHLDEEYRYTNLVLEWYGAEEVCVECDMAEENCQCQQCIDCGSLEDNHYDGKCLMCEEVVDVRVEEE